MGKSAISAGNGIWSTFNQFVKVFTMRNLIKRWNFIPYRSSVAENGSEKGSRHVSVNNKRNKCANHASMINDERRFFVYKKTSLLYADNEAQEFPFDSPLLPLQLLFYNRPRCITDIKSEIESWTKFMWKPISMIIHNIVKRS